jgi:hypothetical protein
MKATKTFLVMGILMLTGCGSMKPDDFVKSQQRFVLEDYFEGKTRAWGLYENRFGDVKRQFVVDINGTWDGKQLILDEDFIFDDGERSTRQWRIRKLPDGSYEGRADDVIGVAIGKVGGNALNWRYVLDLKIGETSTLAVTFDDWMFLQPGGVLINRARMSKFGVELGQITISFMKLDADAATRGVMGRRSAAADGGEQVRLPGSARTVATPRPSTPNGG